MNPLNQIADELDNLAGLDLATMSHDALKLTVRSYAVALRALAGQAAGSASAESPVEHQRRLVEEARAEFQGKVKKIDAGEFGEVQAFECADGPAKGTAITLPAAMPVGAFTCVEDDVYRLGKDGKLHCFKDAPEFGGREMFL